MSRTYRTIANITIRLILELQARYIKASHSFALTQHLPRLCWIEIVPNMFGQQQKRASTIPLAYRIMCRES